MRHYFYAIITSLALAAAVIYIGVVYGQEDPTGTICYTPDSVKVNPPFPLLFEIKDTDLQQFNTNYTRETGNEAPDNDLVLIFGDRDKEIWWLLSFSDGCLAAKPAPISRGMVNKLRSGATDL